MPHWSRGARSIDPTLRFGEAADKGNGPRGCELQGTPSAYRSDIDRDGFFVSP
jgi:hypothetical protein